MKEYIPVNLRTEYEKEPLGIQNSAPLLSWQVQCNKKNAEQTAYRITASSSQEALGEGIYDMWDSQKVNSSRCYGIVYDGKPLKSAMRIFWQVRIWNENDECSESSEISWFETGLLSQKIQHLYSADWNHPTVHSVYLNGQDFHQRYHDGGSERIKGD